MHYITHYRSPLGDILLAADEQGLTGLWFEGQKHFARGLAPDHAEQVTPALAGTCRWLDIYFAGQEPDLLPPIHLTGTTFQTDVWQALAAIPYGKTVTYGDIAAAVGCPSARAVGSVVGRNPVSILIPCHRVVGAGGKLTGYAGGMERKTALLRLEGLQI